MVPDKRKLFEPILVSQYAGVSIQTIQRTYLHGRAAQTAAVAKAISIL